MQRHQSPPSAKLGKLMEAGRTGTGQEPPQKWPTLGMVSRESFCCVPSHSLQCPVPSRSFSWPPQSLPGFQSTPLAPLPDPTCPHQSSFVDIPAGRLKYSPWQSTLRARDAPAPARWAFSRKSTRNQSRTGRFYPLGVLPHSAGLWFVPLELFNHPFGPAFKDGA